MENKISLTPENVKYLQYAFAHFFPEDTIYAADSPFGSGEFNWKNRADFIDFIFRLTGVQIKSEKDIENIKKAEFAVEELVSEEKAESNMPDKEARELQEEERKKREKELKEAQEKGQKEVEKSLEKKQELAEKQIAAEKLKAEFKENIQKHEEIQSFVENKKVYAKIEVPEVPELDENTRQFIEQAKTYPQSFRKEISEVVKAKIATSESAKFLSKEEISILADKTANDTILAIYNPVEQVERNFQTAVLTSLSKDKVVLGKVITDPKTKDLLQSASSELSFFKDSTKLSRSLLSSVNENLATATFGPDPNEIKVSFYNQPVDSQTHEIDLGQLNSGYTQLTGSESEVFDQVSSLTQGEAKNFLMTKARGFLDSQITKLPADNVLRGFYSSPVGQKVLDVVGLSKSTPLGNSAFVGVIQKIPGASTFFQSIGGSLGIDFVGGVAVETAGTVAVEGTVLVGEAAAAGIETGVVATGAAAQAAPKAAAIATGAKLNLNMALGNAVAKGASWALARVGATAASAKIGAMVGTGIMPVIGTLVGLVAGAVFGKIIEKINWKKVKEYAAPIMGAVVAIVALPFVGIATAAVIGVSVTVVAAGMGAGMGGLTLGGVGVIVLRTFGNIGRIFLVTAGLPLVIGLMVLPIIVVLILLIINSGAYIVPPTASVFGSVSSPYIGITKTPIPSGPFANSALPKTITYEVTITAKKSQLTNVSINYDCQVISSSQLSCPAISNVPAQVDTISPSNPLTFTYTSTYDQKYEDSAIIDTITVVADVPEQKGASADTSASVTFGNPPISCPVPGGRPLNSMNYSYDAQADTGHGSTQYWAMMGPPSYRYALPQTTGCMQPGDCTYYGYAYDIFPNGVTSVFAPTVLGKDVTWNLSGSFSNGSAGYSVVYTDSSGSYTAVFTHIDSVNVPSTVTSGTQITTLFDQGGNTHLHLEFQVNGRWVKPENYFCI